VSGASELGDSCDSAWVYRRLELLNSVTPATVLALWLSFWTWRATGYFFLGLIDGGRRGKKGIFFLGCSKTTTFCLGLLYFIFYYNMGISVTLTLKS
jgi:hypothetical protein